MGVPLNHHILNRKLLPSRPPHNNFRHFDTLFIGQRDGQLEGFSWPHGQVTKESPTRTRKIPHGALALKRPCVVRDGALHRVAAEGTNREGHGGLAGRRIVGGGRSNRKAGGLENTGTHPWKINQSPDGWRYDIDHGGLCRLRA